MSIIDTPSKSAGGVEVIDTNQQSLTPTGAYQSANDNDLRSHSHIESIGRKVSGVHSHVHPAFEAHRIADPMAAGLTHQLCSVHMGDLSLLGAAPNGG
jgi:hypothetical protein